jgi:hypothetical protein
MAHLKVAHKDNPAAQLMAKRLEWAVDERHKQSVLTGQAADTMDENVGKLELTNEWLGDEAAERGADNGYEQIGEEALEILSSPETNEQFVKLGFTLGSTDREARKTWLAQTD